MFTSRDIDADLMKRGFKTFFVEYNIIINGVLGIALLTGILAFIVLLLKLAKDGDKPQERSKTLNEMLVVGMITALTGTFWGVMGLLYSIVAG